MWTMTAAMILKMPASWKKSYVKPRHCFRRQRHHFANKCPSSQSNDFSSSCVWMWELHHEESWPQKNRCFWTVVLEKTLESPLDGKEIQPVHPKGNQSWIFIGRTDVEAETPVLWPPDVKNWLTGKDPDAGKDWRQEEKGTTEDEMVGWHHWLNRHEFEQAPGVGDGQGSQECCGPWGCKESDMSEQLNWTVSISTKIISTKLGPGSHQEGFPGTKIFTKKQEQGCLVKEGCSLVSSGRSRGSLSHTVGRQEGVIWYKL